MVSVEEKKVLWDFQQFSHSQQDITSSLNISEKKLHIVLAASFYHSLSLKHTHTLFLLLSLSLSKQLYNLPPKVYQFKVFKSDLNHSVAKIIEGKSFLKLLNHLVQSTPSDTSPILLHSCSNRVNWKLYSWQSKNEAFKKFSAWRSKQKMRWWKIDSWRERIFLFFNWFLYNECLKCLT